MNRYLVEIVATTEVNAIDENDAKNRVMKKLMSLNYYFSSIKRIAINIEGTKNEIKRIEKTNK